jgi:hypothetical protein
VAQVGTGNTQSASARRQQPAQHAESGGLARAVCTEQAEHFALADREADVVHRMEAAEGRCRLCTSMTVLSDAGARCGAACGACWLAVLLLRPD